MPIGLGFQGIGITAWGVRLFGVARFAGSVALALGLGILLAALASTVNPMLVMAAIPATALWSGLAGILLRRRTL